MTPEKRDYLLAIGPRTMMLFLRADIRTRFVDSRNSDAKCAISLLPGKGPQRGEGFMNPFGGIALEKLHGLRDRHRRRQTQENVHMIGDSADRERLHSVLARDAAEVRPETFANLRRE